MFGLKMKLFLAIILMLLGSVAWASEEAIRIKCNVTYKEFTITFPKSKEEFVDYIRSVKVVGSETVFYEILGDKIYSLNWDFDTPKEIEDAKVRDNSLLIPAFQSPFLGGYQEISRLTGKVKSYRPLFKDDVDMENPQDFISLETEGQCEQVPKERKF